MSLSLCSTPDHALSLARLMSIFYNRRTDHNRLVSEHTVLCVHYHLYHCFLLTQVGLCQKWLQFSHGLAATFPSNTLCVYHLRQLLVHCTVSLTSDPSQNIAIPLRMIETFLSPTLYQHTPQTVSHLFSHLVQNGGYFRCLRTLMEHRVPPPDGPEDYALSPLTSSLMEYISRPFKTVLATPLYLPLARELLSPPLTPHTCHIVTPHLLTLKLNLGLLIDTLLTGVTTGQISPSMEMLYVLLKLIHTGLHTINQTSLAKYLELTSLFLGHAPSSHVTSHGELDEEFESSDEDDLDPLESGEDLRKCCVSIITEDRLAIRIKQET